MLKWIARNRILAQLFAGLLLFVIALPLSGIFEELGRTQYRSPGDLDEYSVLKVQWEYGPDSPEAATALRLLAESSRPRDLVALLDPETGRAISAWPTANVGKRLEEMVLRDGTKLPDIAALKLKLAQTVELDRPGAKRPPVFALWRTDRLEVSLRPIYVNPEANVLSFYKPSPYRTSPYAPRLNYYGDGLNYYGDGLNYYDGGQSGSASPRDEWEQQRAEALKLQEEMGKTSEALKSIQDHPLALYLEAHPPEGFTLAHLGFALSLALTIIGFILYWLSAAWWVFADARQRGARAVAWGLLVLLTNVVGILAYLIARPEQWSCPSCGGPAERSFAHCPACGHRLKELCTACGGPLRKGWHYCPGCGTPLAQNPPAPEAGDA